MLLQKEVLLALSLCRLLLQAVVRENIHIHLLLLLLLQQQGHSYEGVLQQQAP
jgi:hypothetical protein